MKKALFLLPLMTAVLFWTGCGGDPASAGDGSTTSPTDPSAEPESGSRDGGKPEFRVETGPAYAYRNTADFKEYNGEPKATPVIDYGMGLSGLDASGLRILRSTVEARKGETFNDDQLRQHFMNVDWYQPVWYDHNYRPQLDEDEKAFVARVKEAEKTLQADRVPQGADVTKPDRIANRHRFAPELMEKMDPVLAKNGLAIVPAKHEQMFHIYDQNNYQAIPSFITTDFYLQLMHVYFSRILQEVEKEFLAPTLARIMEGYHQVGATAAKESDPRVKAAGEYLQMFFAMGYELLTEKKKPVPAVWQPAYDEEIARAKAGSGQGSQLLKSEFFDFSLFKPRGHYTRSPEQERYFRAMMWLQSAPFYKQNEIAFNAAILACRRATPDLLKLRDRLSSPIDFIVGEPNRPAFQDPAFVALVQQNTGETDVFSDKFKEEFAFLLKRMYKNGFTKGANEETEAELKKFALYFLPQRYTFDAEVLIRLVDIRRKDLRSDPRRPFPKGLDVMAVMGSEVAKDILLRQYKEAEKWPAYPDTLARLQQQFANFKGDNIYNQWMRDLRAVLEDKQGPLEKESRGWQIKNLNTALGSWTELKHNTILYADQPLAAQMGDGGEDWPPAWIPAYVENNQDFWMKSLALIRSVEQVLGKVDMLTENIRSKTKSLLTMGEKLQSIAGRQASGKVSNDELDYLRFIGGSAEWLTLELMDKDNLQWFELNETDRFMALAADVYTYQGRGSVPPGVLEEAIGYADEVYVAVPWKDGSLQLMRGAVFSYYEFRQPIDERLTDEEWQKMLKDEQAPARPEWMQEVLVSGI